MKENTKIITEEKPDLEDPIFIEGLTGVGHVGRTAAGYLVDHINATKFGEITSWHFPHWTIVNEDKELDMLKNELYYWKSEEEGQRDLIILIGNAQSLDPEGHYEIAEKVIDLIKDLGVEQMITLGGYGTGEMVEDPSVFGVVNDKELKEEYEDFGVEFDHSIGQVIGASGLLPALGKDEGIEGLCLLGETPGFMLSDPKATEEVLKVLDSIIKIDIDYSNLEDKIKEAEKVLKRIQKLKKNAQEGEPSKSSEELGYIG